MPSPDQRGIKDLHDVDLAEGTMGLTGGDYIHGQLAFPIASSSAADRWTSLSVEFAVA
jgi:hypothetical protein